MAIKKAHMVAITSVKGGTGKTTFALNLAGMFSLKNQRTLIVDLDLFNNAVTTSLNIEPKSDIFVLTEDIQNNKFTQVEDYVTKYNDLIDVLASSKDPRTANIISSKNVQKAITKLRTKYDVIIFDTNNFSGEINLVTFDMMDQIFYIVSNDPIDIKNMRTMVSIYRNMEKDNYKIILNDAKDIQKNYFNKYDIKNIIKKNIDYVIPGSFYIKNIDKYVIEGKILVLEEIIRKNYKDTIKIFDKIVQEILNEEVI